MRIAIISDIHEDFQMLESAFSQIRHMGYDKLVCLGDITGYAHEFYSHTPDANACLDLLREIADIVIPGNHDLFNSRRLPSYHQEKNMPDNWYDLDICQQIRLTRNTVWLYNEEIIPGLSRENAEFLQGLDEWAIMEVGEKRLLLTHFLVPDHSGVGRWFPCMTSELKPHFRFMEEQDCQLAFVGHSHPEAVTIASKMFWSNPNQKPVSIRKYPRIVLCPPIVSGKRKSSFIIFDSQNNEITSYLV